MMLRTKLIFQCKKKLACQIYEINRKQKFKAHSSPHGVSSVAVDKHAVTAENRCV